MFYGVIDTDIPISKIANQKKTKGDDVFRPSAYIDEAGHETYK